jgi:hypothetical protein
VKAFPSRRSTFYRVLANGYCRLAAGYCGNAARRSTQNFMKNVFILLLLASTIALGAISFVQHQNMAAEAAKLSRSESRRADLEAQLREKAEAVENASLTEQKSRVLKETLTQTSSAAQEQSKKLEQLQESLAAAKTNTTGNMFAGMFKDPKMKEMLKSQQKLVMGPMIDKMYGAAIQQLNLTPEQASSFKDLLEKKMSAGSDFGLSILDGDVDAAKRKELAAEAKKQTDGYDEQIKQLLGDDGYDKFKTYEKGAADRMALGQIKDQLAGTPTALSGAQEEQLMTAMEDQRNGFKWTTDFNNRNSADADPMEMFNEDRVAKFAQEKEQYDQEMLARAKKILNPEQLDAYEKNLNSQRAMQITGMKMAAQMFGTKK